MRTNMTDEQCAIMRKTLEHIIGNPAELDQRHWGRQPNACGTRFCFAGHALVTVLGMEPQWTSPDMFGNRYAHFIVGDTAGISTMAREAMGLSVDDGEDLFWHNNTIRDLVRKCYTISDGRVDLRHLVDDGQAS